MIFDDLKEYIEDKESEYSIKKDKLFLYGVIFIFIFTFISRFNINLTTIFGVVIGYFIIMYLSKSSKNHGDKKKEILNKKKVSIRPREQIIEKYDDIVNLLYSIQDLYVYNPPVYEEMVESIKNFFIVYEESMKIPELANQNYSIAENKFYNAINSLHSIVLNTNGTKKIDNKINTAFRMLHGFLKKYLDEIELVIKKNIKYNGYNVNTLVLDPNRIKPYNFSNYKDYSFDVV